MTPLEFCEYYESKGNELNLLTILKDELTLKGLETYTKIKTWLVDNLDKYFEAQEKL